MMKMERKQRMHENFEKLSDKDNVSTTSTKNEREKLQTSASLGNLKRIEHLLGLENLMKMNQHHFHHLQEEPAFKKNEVFLDELSHV